MAGDYIIGSDKWNGLSKIIEEMGELHQVFGKLIGSNGDTNHWSGDLSVKMIEEIGDVQASILFFLDKNFDPLDLDKLSDRIDEKYELFQKWDSEQRTVK